MIICTYSLDKVASMDRLDILGGIEIFCTHLLVIRLHRISRHTHTLRLMHINTHKQMYM